jgi:hypothetical protein
LQVPHFSCSYRQLCVDVIPCCVLHFNSTVFTACTKYSELFTYVNLLKLATCLNICLCIFITSAYSFKSLRVFLTVNVYSAIIAVEWLEISNNISINVGLLFFSSVSIYGLIRFLKCLKPHMVFLIDKRHSYWSERMMKIKCGL